jgi:hypothetical protein
MLDLNDLAILTYVITLVTIDTDLIARHISDGKLLVRISKRDD